MAELFTAGKENTVEVMFVLPQKHSQLLISDGFSACQMGQVSKFIDMKVHSNVGTYLKPFFFNTKVLKLAWLEEYIWAVFL